MPYDWKRYSLNSRCRPSDRTDSYLTGVCYLLTDAMELGLMNNLLKVLFVGFYLFSQPSVGSATESELNGFFKFYDESGNDIFGDIFPITGRVDFGSGLLEIDDFLFFGAPWQTTVVEILEPGTYTRDFDPAFGGTISISGTIPEGTFGAYTIATWNVNEMPAFHAWQPVPTAIGTDYIPVDVDVISDGSPGMLMTYPPFPGFAYAYVFSGGPIGPPKPGITLALNVEGGTTHECTGVEGDEVLVLANVTLFGGAELDSINWTVDGEAAGHGSVLTAQLSLGRHSIESTALTTTGESATRRVEVHVRDTTRPDISVAFLNNQGEEVTVAAPGQVEISITATDLCDPSPAISNGRAVPSFTVENGDILNVNRSLSNLNLPATSLFVDAIARDASGNAITGQNTLILR